MTRRPADVINAVLYGVINAILAIPALFGYAAVIFSDGAYVDVAAPLAKAVVLSAAVHQCVFSWRSTLPFAIGQVQDAGLIFLSKMATDVARALDGSAHDVAATALCGLGLSTALLGLVLVGVGRARMTWLVSYLPLPVLGGYLAFIGLFCIEAGLSLCIGVPLNGPRDWPQLYSPPWRLVLAAPGLLGGILLSRVAKHDKNGTRLPLAMVAMPLAFYTIVYLTGYSLKDARQQGWLFANDSTTDVADLRDVVGLYDLDRVSWHSLPQLFPIWCSMVVVVGFSSCLDVAAIEVDLGKPLDMDAELTTVGVSNTVAGLLGGFTGSYIFSQTIFTCRAGCRSRIAGLVVVFCEVVAGATRLDLLGALPLFFFAATLAFVGVDLMDEWLLQSRHKWSTRSEYASVWITLGAIQALGLVRGLVTGCAACAFTTVAAQIEADAPQRVIRSSLGAPRAPRDARKLRVLRSRLIVLELRGRIWWGTAASLLARIKKALRRADDDDETSSLFEASQDHASRVVVLDCRLVDGLDASACRACFRPLASMAQAKGFGVALAGLGTKNDALLRIHGVYEAGGSSVRTFQSMDEAVRWAEGRQLQAPTPEHPRRRVLIDDDGDQPRRFLLPQRAASLPGGRGHAARALSFDDPRSPRALSTGLPLSRAAARYLARVVLESSDLETTEAALRDAGVKEVRLKAGEAAFALGEEGASFFCVVTGTLSLRQITNDLETGAFQERDGVGLVVNAGAFAGYVDFLLKRPRRFTARAGNEAAATCAVFDAASLKALPPTTLASLQRVLLRAAAAELANTSR